MRKILEYWDIKLFASKEDENACEEYWGMEIELYVDEYGCVWNEGGQYIANVILLKDNEEY